MNDKEFEDIVFGAFLHKTIKELQEEPTLDKELEHPARTNVEELYVEGNIDDEEIDIDLGGFSPKQKDDPDSLNQEELD